MTPRLHNNNKDDKHALVRWDNNTFSVVKISDIIRAKSISVELNKSYTIRWGRETHVGVVTCIGSKEHCDSILDKVAPLVLPKNVKNPTSTKTIKHPINTTSANTSNMVSPSIRGSNRSTIDTFTQISNSAPSPLDESNRIVDPVQEHDSVSSTTASNELERQLDERNSHIIDLNEQITSKNDEIIALNEKLELYQTINDGETIRKLVGLSIQILKYIGTEEDRNEVRHFTEDSEQFLIHKNYPNEFMPRTLYDRVKQMINDKKSGSQIFRQMACALVPDVEIWGNNDGKYMRTNYKCLSACKDFINLENNVRFLDTEFKTTIRNLCGESKRRIEIELNQSVVG